MTSCVLKYLLDDTSHSLGFFHTTAYIIYIYKKYLGLPPHLVFSSSFFFPLQHDHLFVSPIEAAIKCIYE